MKDVLRMNENRRESHGIDRLMPSGGNVSMGQRLLRVGAYDGTVVGGLAVALMSGTYALLDLPVDSPLLGLAFCGALMLYQLDRVLTLSPEDRVNQPERMAWVERHRRYVWTTIGLAAVSAALLMPMLRSQTLVVGIVLGTVGLVYVLPVLPGARRLKSIGWAKPIAIAGAWTLGAVMLPVIEAGQPLGADAWSLAGYRFLFLIPNALLADWVDRAGDARAGLRTVATQWTPRRIRGVATGALGVALLGVVAAWMRGAPVLLAVDAIGPVLMLGAVWRAPRWERLARTLVPDLIVAWPLVPFLLGLLLGR